MIRFKVWVFAPALASATGSPATSATIRPSTARSRSRVKKASSACHQSAMAMPSSPPKASTAVEPAARVSPITIAKTRITASSGKATRRRNSPATP